MPFVRTNDVETYYETRGEGPPLVLIHAAAIDHTQWTAQVDRLDEDYTVISYDVRGHGRTGGSDRDTYTIELLAEDLDELLTGLDIENPVVCGLSTGGCIAQVYAATHPDDLAGLVLASTFGTELLTAGEWLQRSVMLRAVIPLVRLVGYDRVERAMVWAQEKAQGEAVSGDYEKFRQLRAESPGMETDEFAKVFRALANFDDSSVYPASIDVPTLVLYGENEPGFVRRHARRFAEDIPDVTVRAVPDAGHASNLDNPEFFTDALREFLETVSPDGESEVTEDAAT